MRTQNSPTYTGGNALLDLLVAAASNALVEEAAIMRFESGSILLDSNEAIKHVYFPVDMMISITTLMRDASEIEVGTVGCEGMSGVQLVTGTEHVPGKAICQVAGSAVRMPADHFLQCMDRFAAAHRIMLRYVQAVINLLEISIACNALHPVAARCARWLLVTQDRVGRDDFGLTQEFLAVMLGVRRATVNGVAQELQEQGAMRYTRGQAQIVDRAKLERASCECYRLSIDRYVDLLGGVPFPRSSSLPNGLPRAL